MVETNPDSRPRPHAQPSRRAHITRTSARAQSSCSAAVSSEPRRPCCSRYVAALEAFAWIRSRLSSSNSRTACLRGGTAFPQVSLQGPRFAGVRLPHHGPGRPHVPLVSP